MGYKDLLGRCIDKALSGYLRWLAILFIQLWNRMHYFSWEKKP